MADQTLTERLQPSLLDRLTDDAPGDVKENRDSRVIDLRRLREIIQRDLSWLLNTYDNSTLIDAKAYPNVFNSVLTFGVREVAGEFSTADRASKIRDSIFKAIQRFEPRIIPNSLSVILRDQQGNDRGGGSTTVDFDIAADIWAQPLPMELYLRSQVDITTGELKLERPATVSGRARRD